MDDWKVKLLRKLFFYEKIVGDFDINYRLEEFISIEYDLIVDSNGSDYFIYEEDGFRIWIDEDIEEEDNKLKKLKQWLKEKDLMEWLDKMYIKE